MNSTVSPHHKKMGSMPTSDVWTIVWCAKHDKSASLHNPTKMADRRAHVYAMIVPKATTMTTQGNSQARETWGEIVAERPKLAKNGMHTWYLVCENKIGCLGSAPPRPADSPRKHRGTCCVALFPGQRKTPQSGHLPGNKTNDSNY